MRAGGSLSASMATVASRGSSRTAARERSSTTTRGSGSTARTTSSTSQTEISTSRNPPYGLAKGPDDPSRELDFCGVYRLTPNGELTLLVKDLERPNGLAFSPDEKILYVAQSDPKKAIWMAYNVKGDGTLGGGRVFADVTTLVDKLPGLPDGMKIDREGNLFATGPGGVHIYSPDGKHLGRIETGQRTSNCNWGDDGSTLYMTADSYICRLRTKTKGAGW